jgi:hypothetical protein
MIDRGAVSSVAGSGASSGKVDTGFPKRSCSAKHLERDNDLI